MKIQKAILEQTSQWEKLDQQNRNEIQRAQPNKAELVGASDICPQALWTAYFIEAQGYEIKDNDLYQDNMSML